MQQLTYSIVKEGETKGTTPLCQKCRVRLGLDKWDEKNKEYISK